MTAPLQNRPRRQIRVILSSTALLSFMSVRKAAALAVAQLGVAAVFVAGITRSALGDSAAWFALAAAMVGALCRAIAIESWALLIPWRRRGALHQAFGVRAAKAAAAAGLVERLLLAALAGIVIGQYASTVALTAIAGWRLTGYVRPEDFATIVGVFLVGLLWLRARIGLDLTLRPDCPRGVDCRRDPDGRDRLGLHQPGARTCARGPCSPHRRPSQLEGWRAIDVASTTSSASPWFFLPLAGATPSRAGRTNCGRCACRRCN